MDLAGFLDTVGPAELPPLVVVLAAVDLDYLVVTDPDLGDLPAAVPPGTPARILIAARVGNTRLIDNMPLVIGRSETSGGDH